MAKINEVFEAITDKISSFDLEMHLIARAFKAQRPGLYSSLGDTLGVVSLERSLRSSARMFDGSRLGDAYSIILKRYHKGATLPRMFSGLVPIEDIQVLNAMQQASKTEKQMAEGFARLAVTTEMLTEIRRSLLSVLFRVIIYGGLFFGVLAGMHQFMFGQLLQLIPLSVWPTGSRYYYTVIESLFTYKLVTFPLIFATIVWYILAIPRWTGPIRQRLDKTILFGWYRDYKSTNILMALAMQMQAGAGIGTAIRELLQYANPWEAYYLKKIAENNETGVQGGEIFDVGLFSDTLLAQIVLLADGTDLGTALVQVGITMQAKVIDSFKRRIAIIGDSVKNFFTFMMATAFIFLMSVISANLMAVLNKV